MHHFEKTRTAALVEWQSLTGRACGEFYDDISEAYECKWQDKNEYHVSIFCSLGVWADCLSQLLQDKRYDYLDVSDEHQQIDLYSFYNQVLLISSEIIDDLVNMYLISTNTNNKKIARSYLTGSRGYDLQELFGFIKNIVKHKTENLHICNHHLPIYIEDSRKKRSANSRISVGNIGDLESKKSLMMPSLVKIVRTIAYAYRNMDKKFSEDPSTYVRIATKYQELET